MKGRKRRIKILTLSTLVFVGIFLIASQAFTEGFISSTPTRNNTVMTPGVRGVVRGKQALSVESQSDGPEAADTQVRRESADSTVTTQQAQQSQDSQDATSGTGQNRGCKGLKWNVSVGGTM